MDLTKTRIITALLAFLPISEGRGAIPYGYFNNLPLFEVLTISLIFNILIPVAGFVFLSTLHGLLMKWPFYSRIIGKFLERAREKVGKQVNKYGLFGLALFVAVPLPVTGAWTGTLGAWILGLDKKKSTIAIICGVLVSSAIVTTVILTGSELAKLFTKQF